MKLKQKDKTLTFLTVSDVSSSTSSSVSLLPIIEKILFNSFSSFLLYSVHKPYGNIFVQVNTRSGLKVQSAQ